MIDQSDTVVEGLQLALRLQLSIVVFLAVIPWFYCLVHLYLDLCKELLVVYRIPKQTLIVQVNNEVRLVMNTTIVNLVNLAQVR